MSILFATSSTFNFLRPFNILSQFLNILLILDIFNSNFSLILVTSFFKFSFNSFSSFINFSCFISYIFVTSLSTLSYILSNLVISFYFLFFKSSILFLLPSIFSLESSNVMFPFSILLHRLYLLFYVRNGNFYKSTLNNTVLLIN